MKPCMIEIEENMWVYYKIAVNIGIRVFTIVN